jgi:hypothetical protein
MNTSNIPDITEFIDCALALPLVRVFDSKKLQDFSQFEWTTAIVAYKRIHHFGSNYAEDAIINFWIEIIRAIVAEDESIIPSFGNTLSIMECMNVVMVPCATSQPMRSKLAQVMNKFGTPAKAANAFKEHRLSEIRALDLKDLRWEMKHQDLNDVWYNHHVRREYDERIVHAITSVTKLVP